MALAWLFSMKCGCHDSMNFVIRDRHIAIAFAWISKSPSLVKRSLPLIPPGTAKNRAIIANAVVFTTIRAVNFIFENLQHVHKRAPSYVVHHIERTVFNPNDIMEDRYQAIKANGQFGRVVTQQ